MGYQVTILKPFPTADYSVMLTWTRDNTQTIELDTSRQTDLEQLFGEEWKHTCWVQLFMVDGGKWNTLSKLEGGLVTLRTLTWRLLQVIRHCPRKRVIGSQPEVATYKKLNRQDVPIPLYNDTTIPRRLQLDNGRAV